MIKKILLHIILNSICLPLVWGQTFFNEAYEIPSNLGGTNVINGQFVDGQIKVGLLHFYGDGVASTISCIVGDEMSLTTFSDIACGVNCLLFDGDNMFIHGNSNLLENNAALVKLDSELNALWTTSYILDGTLSSNLRAKIARDYIYLFSLSEFSDPYHRITNLRKLGKDGEEIWSYYYGNENIINYPWDIDISLSDHVYLASGIVEFDSIGRKGEIKKLDQSGGEIWTTRLPEVLPDGGGRVYVSVLSNGNLAVRAERNLKEGEHMYYSDPVMIYTIDQEGNILSDTTLLTTGKVELFFSEIVAGKGDYFYAYGHQTHWIDDEFWGVIYKFSNAGNLIWKRKYRHPDFEDDPIILTYGIDELIELESGELITIGQIIAYGEDKGYVWTMRLSEDGCLSENNCDEEVVTSTSMPVLVNPIEIKVRLAYDYIHIENESASALNEVILYNVFGQKIQLTKCLGSICEINILNYTPGIYILNIKLENGTMYSEKVLIP